jgi:serine/threonine protein kinase
VFACAVRAELRAFDASSFLRQGGSLELTGEMGTLRWMAPEVARNERYQMSADVFSFAMLLFELITHQCPFNDRLPLQAVVATALQGLRPGLPTGIPDTITSLIQRCWHATSAERPTFVQVQEMLAEYHQVMNEVEREWLDAPAGHPVYAQSVSISAQSSNTKAVAGARRFSGGDAR